MENKELFQDDGSLSCLNLPADAGRKRFSCPDAKLADLVGKTFWLIDYFSGVKSRFAEDRYIFKLKFNLEDSESQARKVCTSSPDIEYILEKLAEMGKFPRKVTLKKEGKNHLLDALLLFAKYKEKLYICVNNNNAVWNAKLSLGFGAAIL